MYTERDEENAEMFLDLDLIPKLTSKIENEIKQNDILSSISTDGGSSYTLADEPLNILISSSSSS
jgi:hypothetical protein